MRISLCTIASLVVVGSAIGIGQGRPNNPDHVLDLLVSPASPHSITTEEGLRWLPPTPPADSGPVPTFPFEVKLLPPDRMAYALGELMTFGLLLKNISSAPIEFPWSTDGSLFKPSMAGARQMQFLLTFTHPVLSQQFFFPPGVFGSDEVPGSLRTIQPNETLLIRVAAPVELHRAVSGMPLDDWASNVSIKVSVMLNVPSRYYPPGTSHNQVPIELQKK